MSDIYCIPFLIDHEHKIINASLRSNLLLKWCYIAFMMHSYDLKIMTLW